jgi:hypothetical protein
MNAFISYNGLPINLGGAHKISSRSPGYVYQKVLLFLNTYTTTKSPDKTYIELGKNDFSDLWKYSTLFGWPKFDIDNFIANRQKRVTWSISIQKIHKALQVISDKEDVVLCATWKFRFIDPSTKEILNGQDRIPIIDERLTNSQIYVRLSKKISTISVWFTFPFDGLNEENLRYIEGVKDLLPFRFSEEGWRIWKLSKNDHWTPRKLKVPDM